LWEAGDVIEREEDVTDSVVAEMSRTADPRTRQILESLVRHLHGFVRDVELTEAEYRAGLELLNRVGQATNDAHNEAVVLGGVLGLSALVNLLNNDHGEGTDQNQLGPFWRLGAPETPNGGTIVRSVTPGPPLFVELTIRDESGAPVPGCRVEVWQASTVGRYENEDPDQADMNLRGRFTSDADGAVRFRSVLPSGYPVPTHAVVGEVLAAQGRHPFRPAHLHVIAHVDGFRTLVTQLYVDDDPHLETDVVFAVTERLVGGFERHDEAHPETGVEPPWYSLARSLTLHPGDAGLPPPPIR
jgi:catechol 1,2-dioxygenase